MLENTENWIKYVRDLGYFNLPFPKAEFLSIIASSIEWDTLPKNLNARSKSFLSTRSSDLID